MDFICRCIVGSEGGASETGGKQHLILNFVFLIGLLLGGALTLEGAGLGPRVGNDTLRLPQQAYAYQYKTENAFGDLSFTYPMTVVSPPGERNRVFVAE